jgi:hypothetical protein
VFLIRVFSVLCVTFWCGHSQTLGDYILNKAPANAHATAFIKSVLKDQLGASQKVSLRSLNLKRLECLFYKKQRAGCCMPFTMMDVYHAYDQFMIPIHYTGV